MCMCLYLYVHVYVLVLREVRSGLWTDWNWRQQEVVSCPAWVLGTKHQSSVRAASTINQNCPVYHAPAFLRLC